MSDDRFFPDDKRSWKLEDAHFVTIRLWVQRGHPPVTCYSPTTTGAVRLFDSCFKAKRPITYFVTAPNGIKSRWRVARRGGDPVRVRGE